ncbi:hypothetical protein [Burkholderia sp. BCC0405]|uniref:hypothetical protein n=1 Tax=Burkholderia sp. BCC0405 TaxID=2676298 RepID=UPI00158D9CBA|nr:hypothetical protein [Burkholderia sp. BCC0405]
MKHLTVLTGQGAAGAFAQPRQDARLRVGVRLPSPDTLRRDVPASFAALATVDAGRSQPRAILERRAACRLRGDRSVHRLGGDRGRAAACAQPAARPGAPTWPAYAAFPPFLHHQRNHVYHFC